MTDRTRSALSCAIATFLVLSDFTAEDVVDHTIREANAQTESMSICDRSSYLTSVCVVSKFQDKLI